MQASRYQELTERTVVQTRAHQVDCALAVQYGWTALMHAATQCWQPQAAFEMIKCLVDHGADVNASHHVRSVLYWVFGLNSQLRWLHVRVAKPR